MATPMTKANKDIGELIKNEGKKQLPLETCGIYTKRSKKDGACTERFFQCKEIEKFKLDLRAKEGMYKGK